MREIRCSIATGTISSKIKTGHTLGTAQLAGLIGIHKHIAGRTTTRTGATREEGESWATGTNRRAIFTGEADGIAEGAGHVDRVSESSVGAGSNAAKIVEIVGAEATKTDGAAVALETGGIALQTGGVVVVGARQAGRQATANHTGSVEIEQRQGASTVTVGTIGRTPLTSHTSHITGQAMRGVGLVGPIRTYLVAGVGIKQGIIGRGGSVAR
jgi:hypothetical protein